MPRVENRIRFILKIKKMVYVEEEKRKKKVNHKGKNKEQKRFKQIQDI